MYLNQQLIHVGMIYTLRTPTGSSMYVSPHRERCLRNKERSGGGGDEAGGRTAETDNRGNATDDTDDRRQTDRTRHDRQTRQDNNRQTPFYPFTCVTIL